MSAPAAPSPSPKPPARPNLSTSRLARFAVATVVAGFFVFIIGIYPGLIRLDLTAGIGLLQIGTFLFGITVMTFGAYLYAYATRHRALPRSLREDVGLRLMATGLVICYACGFADVLGIGSHFGSERPLLGWLQAGGVALGVLVIVAGIVLYARR